MFFNVDDRMCSLHSWG